MTSRISETAGRVIMSEAVSAISWSTRLVAVRWRHHWRHYRRHHYVTYYVSWRDISLSPAKCYLFSQQSTPPQDHYPQSLRLYLYHIIA